MPLLGDGDLQILDAPGKWLENAGRVLLPVLLVGQVEPEVLACHNLLEHLLDLQLGGAVEVKLMADCRLVARQDLSVFLAYLDFLETSDHLL